MRAFMTKARSHYDNLKVTPDAPIEVIRAAYKALSQKHHPDRNPGCEQSLRNMRIINEAYEVLSNPLTRASHDQWLAEHSSAKAKSPPKRQHQTAPASHTLAAGSVRIRDLPGRQQGRIVHRLEESGEHLSVNAPSASAQCAVGALVSGIGALVALSQISGLDWGWRIVIGWLAAFGLAHYLTGLLAQMRGGFRNQYVITRIYVMKCTQGRLYFWPITDLKHVEATNFYRKGMGKSAYNSSRLTLDFGDHKHDITLSSESLSQLLLNRLHAYRSHTRAALACGDTKYLAEHDDFAGSPPASQTTPWLIRHLGKALAYSAAALAATVFSITVHDAHLGSSQSSSFGFSGDETYAELETRAAQSYQQENKYPPINANDLIEHR